MTKHASRSGDSPMGQRLRVGGLAVGLLLALVLVGSTYYTVEPEEVAVVTRFGRFARLEPPGLHFKWPLGIEQAERVKADRVQKEEFGYRTGDVRGTRTEYAAGDWTDESLMLTGDLNQADVTWSVQYRVNDPRAYLFNVSDPRSTLRAVSEAAMRSVVGDRGINEVLTTGKGEIEREAQRIMQEALDRYGAGIAIELVKLQDVFPPEPVRDSFGKVESANQEREEMILRARQEYNKAIPAAAGEANRVIAEAEGYALERVARARGAAERFLRLQAEYVKAPEVTRRRLYLEALTEVLPRVREKIIVDEALRGVLPLLDLQRGAPTAESRR